MIEVKDLSYMRQEQVLFSKVAFLLQSGTALQITGPNGIGKSTLLRVIAGLLPVQNGQVILNKSDICYIGHKSNLHPALNVLQNLQFLHALLPTMSRMLKNDLEYALQYFNLSKLSQTNLAELSAGQQQQVGLAPLCFVTAKLWLLDEPLSNLDSGATELLMNLCNIHIQNGGSIICATHTMLPLNSKSTSTLELQLYA